MGNVSLNSLLLETTQTLTFWTHYKEGNKDYQVISATNELPKINEFMGVDRKSGTICSLYNIEEASQVKPSKRMKYVPDNPYKNEVIDTYNDHMKELYLMHKGKCTYNSPLEMGCAFCMKCDELFKLWMSNTSFTKAIAHLRKQLKFIRNKKYQGMTLHERDSYWSGVWEYQRRYKHTFVLFPTCKKLALLCASHISEKYGTPRFFHTCREINFRLLMDFKGGKLMRTDDYIKLHPEIDFKQSGMKYLQLLIINNPQSQSTPIRLCLIPNRPQTFSVPVKDLESLGYIKKEHENSTDLRQITSTFNSEILTYSTGNPDILIKHLMYLLTGIGTTSDITDFFKSSRYHPLTAVSQQLILYTNKDGVPIIASEKDQTDKPESYVFTFQCYGQSDSPISSQCALKLGVESFKDSAPMKMPQLLLEKVQKGIEGTYVDDWAWFKTADDCLSFFLDISAFMTTGPQEREIEFTDENNTCNLCNNVHDDNEESPPFWKKPTYPSSIESYIPFNCPLLRTSQYVTKTHEHIFRTGPYRQFLSGIDNMMFILNPTSNPSGGYSNTDVIEEIRKLSNDDYTIFINIMLRHYSLLIIYMTQVVTSFNGFYFKALLATDDILAEIYPLFLIKDKQLNQLKKELQHLRPDPLLVQQEWSAKKAVGKSPNSQGIVKNIYPAEPAAASDFGGTSGSTVSPHTVDDKNTVLSHNDQMELVLESRRRDPVQSVYMQAIQLAQYETENYESAECAETNMVTPPLMTSDTDLYYIGGYLNDSFADGSKDQMMAFDIIRQRQASVYSTSVNTSEQSPQSTQLGRDFLDNKSPEKSYYRSGNLALSSKHRSLTMYIGSTKKSPKICKNYDDSKYILDQEKYVFSKRTFLCLISQIFDSTGTFLIINTMISKYFWKMICAEEADKEWNDLLPLKYVNVGHLFCEQFFVSCHKVVPRNAVLQHPNCQRILLMMSDAGKNLYSHIVFLITYLCDEEGNVTDGDYMVILRQTYTTMKDWTSDQLELFAFSKGTVMVNLIYNALTEEGIVLQRENVIAASDSTIVLSQCRYNDAQYFKTKKVQSCVSKVQLTYIENSMSLLTQIRYWDQDKAGGYPADMLTKFGTQKEVPTVGSLKHIEDKSKTLEAKHQDLMKTPINDWSHLQIRFTCPKVDDLALVPESQRIAIDIEKYGLLPGAEDITNRPALKYPNVDMYFTSFRLTSLKKSSQYRPQEVNYDGKKRVKEVTYPQVFGDGSVGFEPKHVFVVPLAEIRGGYEKDNYPVSSEMPHFNYTWDMFLTQTYSSSSWFKLGLLKRFAQADFFCRTLKHRSKIHHIYRNDEKQNKFTKHRAKLFDLIEEDNERKVEESEDNNIIQIPFLHSYFAPLISLPLGGSPSITSHQFRPGRTTEISDSTDSSDFGGTSQPNGGMVQGDHMKHVSFASRIKKGKKGISGDTVLMPPEVIEKAVDTKMQIGEEHRNLRAKLSEAIKGIKITKDVNEVFAQNYHFKIPFQSRETTFTADLMRVCYLILYQEYMTEYKLIKGESYRQLQNYLFKQLQYHCICRVDNTKGWDFDFYKKHGNRFMPISVTKRRFHLVSSPTLGDTLVEDRPFYQIQIFLSREQKYILSVDHIFGPIYNLLTHLDKKGHFSAHTHRSIHNLAHLSGIRTHNALLINQGFISTSNSSIFNKIKNICSECRVLKALSMSDKYLIQNTSLSSSSDIHNWIRPPLLGRYSYSCLDLTGPFLINNGLKGTAKEPNKGKTKVWIAVFVDLKSHIVTISPLYSLKSSDVVALCVTHCKTNPTSIFLCDNGSNYSGAKKEANVRDSDFVTAEDLLRMAKAPVNPKTVFVPDHPDVLTNDNELQRRQRMDQPEVDEQFSVKEVRSTLFNNEINFILFSSKHHSAISRVESFIYRIKKVFSHKGIYHLIKKGVYSFNEFSAILSSTESILNSRPLLINESGNVVTPLSIEALVKQSPHLLHKELSDPSALHSLMKPLTAAIFCEVFLKNILNVRKNYMKKSPGVGDHDFMEEGAVVFDPLSFLRTRCFSSSLYRVTYINPSKSWVYLTRPRSLMAMKSQYKGRYYNEKQKYKWAVKNQIYISRPIANLVLIASAKAGEDTLNFEAPYLTDLKENEKIEEYLTAKNDVAVPVDFRNITSPTPLNTSLDLLRHVHPHLTIPPIGDINHKEAESLTELTDTDSANLLRLIFMKGQDPERITLQTMHDLADFLPETPSQKEEPVEKHVLIDSPDPELEPLQDMELTGDVADNAELPPTPLRQRVQPKRERKAPQRFTP